MATYVIGTGGRPAELACLGHFAYLAHEFGDGCAQMVAFIDEGRLNFPDEVTTAFRYAVAALAELHRTCSEEQLRRDLEQGG